MTALPQQEPELCFRMYWGSTYQSSPLLLLQLYLLSNGQGFSVIDGDLFLRIINIQRKSSKESVLLIATMLYAVEISYIIIYKHVYLF